MPFNADSHSCPACGADNGRRVRSCGACGLPLDDAGIGLWRDGSDLIVRADAVFPDRCVKTNLPANGWRKRLQFSWQGAYGQALDVLDISAVTALLVATPLRRVLPPEGSVRAEVLVGISHRALRNRTLKRFAAVALVVLAFIIVFGQSFRRDFDHVLIVGAIGFAVGFVGVLVWSSAGTLLAAGEHTGTHFRLGGAGRKFLRTLPRWPGNYIAGVKTWDLLFPQGEVIETDCIVRDDCADPQVSPPRHEVAEGMSST